GSWLGAPVGLVRADGSTKPSFDALKGLVKGEWWLAPTTLRTDSEGRVSVRGFRGEYELSAAGPSVPFTLAANGDVEVTLPASGGGTGHRVATGQHGPPDGCA